MSVSRGRRASRAIWPVAGGAAVASGAVAWAGGQGAAAAVLVAVGVLTAVAAFLADRTATRSSDLDVEKVADRLADLVRDQWDTEATRRGVGRPPLEVFWEAADSDLVRTWPELLAQAAGGRGGPACAAPGSGPGDLAGHGALLTAYERSPCGRLVVLGEPGAGKTVLLMRFVLDLLARRGAGEPVPLLVPMASWKPDDQSLHAWLEAQILRTYPRLSAVDTATGRRRAGALLDAGLILPVLDGLDEIRVGGRDQALAAVNDGLRSNTGLVLSCRAEEFRAAVHPGPDRHPIHLDGAAAVRLRPLTPVAVGAYLLAGAGRDGPTRWAPALAALADPTSALARALATPLTASLASAVYNPRPRESTSGLPDPADLIALPTPEAVEQHLFAGFVAGAYRPYHDHPTRWNAEQAVRYLAFLARHLEHRLQTTGLAWWEMPAAVPRSCLLTALGLMNGLVIGLVTGLAAGVVVGPVAGLVVGLATGPVAGLAAGLSCRSGNSRPGQLTLRRPRREDLVLALLLGLLSGVMNGILLGLVKGPVVGLLGGSAIGLVGGLGFVLAIRPVFDTDADVHAVSGPRGLLADDRNSGLVGGLLLGSTVGLACGIMTTLCFGFGSGSALALAGGFAAGLGVCLAGGAGESWGWAWSQLVVTRLWLAARRQQPLCLVAFLTEAHDRGVLRQAGAVWEFRHVSLQRHLADDQP